MKCILKYHQYNDNYFIITTDPPVSEMDDEEFKNWCDTFEIFSCEWNPTLEGWFVSVNNDEIKKFIINNNQERYRREGSSSSMSPISMSPISMSPRSMSPISMSPRSMSSSSSLSDLSEDFSVTASDSD